MRDDTAARNVNILVIRNDKLGDFMLAWPAFALLKATWPEARIHALVPGYVKPLADLCPWIDDTFIDERHGLLFRDALALARQIRAAGIDKSISLFSETRTALALWLAHVGERYGPATKVAQLFLNKRLRQRRSQSAKPEYEYNIDLIRYFIAQQHGKAAPLQKAPYLSFAADEIKKVKNAYLRQHRIDRKRELVIIHPGSGGSAINLTVAQYADLARKLNTQGNLHFVITAGPGELATAKALSGSLQDVAHSVYHSTAGLTAFTHFIAASDVFISGSTGPLHIAGALNRRTVAFYSARRSATALRWQTLNEPHKRIAFQPDHFDLHAGLSEMDMQTCARTIKQAFYKTTGA